MNIIQEKRSKLHNDSFWYRGVIAESNGYTLVATGDIRVINCKTGEIVHDISKMRGDGVEGGLFDDNDLKKIDDVNYTWDMNNWFEISDEEIDYDVFWGYDEAIKELRELSKNK